MPEIQRVLSLEGTTITKRDRSRELLLAAAKLFAESGFALVTIKDIANSIGVNTGVIYYYYPNKEALFGAAVKHIAAISLEKYRTSVIGCDEPEALIDSWLQVVVDSHDEVNSLMKIMIDYSKSKMKITGVDEAINQFYLEEHRFLASAIQKGIERKIFRLVDVEQVAFFISVHLDGIFIRSSIQSKIKVATSIKELRNMIWSRLRFSTTDSE
jgi:AcrR family transcriptional regulator